MCDVWRTLLQDRRPEFPVEETGCTVVASQAQLEHDYEFIEQ